MRVYMIITALVLAACSIDTKPLVYGKDFCHTCKMTLMDNKFGSEIVTKKGKTYTFDDVNCLVGFYNSDFEPEENIAHCVVVDFAHPGKFVEAHQAVFVHSEKVNAPMNSQVAAFSSKQDAEGFGKEWNGKIMDWNEIKQTLK